MSIFNESCCSRETFLNHINDNGAIWSDTIYDGEEKMPTHFYVSLDGQRRVQMFMPFEDIPEQVAREWLAQLGIRV